MPIFESPTPWAEIPRTGLPAVVMEDRTLPFGRWPDGAYVKVVHDEPNGWHVPRIYRFDTTAKRWIQVDFQGDFRAGIDVTRISPKRSVLLRRGYGVGSNVAVQVALVDIESSELEHAELPCRSSDTHLVLDAEGGIPGD
ncbi:MAG: hypothetical protein R3B72_31230 [Polyangiaceae bacterium]